MTVWKQRKRGFCSEAQGFKSVYVLSGGMQGWKDFVLFPVRPQGGTDAAFERQAQVAKFFGGAPQVEGMGTPATIAAVMPKTVAPVLPPATETHTSTTQPRKKKEGC